MEVTRPASRLPGPTPPAEPRQTPRTRLRPQIRGCRQFKVLPTTRHSRQPDCPERDRTGRRRSLSRRGLAALLLAKPTGRQHASVFRSSGGDDHRWLETRRRRGKSITTTDFGAGCARDHESLRSIECERRLSSLVFCFDAFSSREPVPTPYPVRGRLSLENAVRVRRRRPTHELARDMRCRECSQLRFYPRKLRHRLLDSLLARPSQPPRGYSARRFAQPVDELPIRITLKSLQRSRRLT
jgi:hypothetical protein